LTPSSIEIERFFKLIKDLGLKKMTNLKLEKKEQRVKMRYNRRTLKNQNVMDIMKDEEDLIPKYDDESSNEEIQDMIDTE
jgi:hypothetical protein